MELFGFENIENLDFILINSTEDILKNSNPKDIVTLNSLKKPYSLLKYCSLNGISFSVIVTSIREAIIANYFQPSFIIVEDLNLAKEVQEIANEYLWDSKVLAVVSSEEEIEVVAKAFIDGVIIKNHIKGL